MAKRFSYIVRAGFGGSFQLEIGGPFVSIKKGDAVCWRQGYRNLPMGPIGKSTGKKWGILSKFEDTSPPTPKPKEPRLLPNGRQIRIEATALDWEVGFFERYFDQWQR